MIAVRTVQHGFVPEQSVRNPKVVEAEESERVCRRHSNDGVGQIVQYDGLSQNSGIGSKCPLPKTMADNDNAIGSGPVIFLCEIASLGWGYA